MDRLAEEEPPALGLDWHSRRRRRSGTRRCPPRRRCARHAPRAVTELQRPTLALGSQRGDGGDLDPCPTRERLDHGLRPVEVAVLAAPGRADHRPGVQAGDELAGLVGRYEARRDAGGVLDGDVGAHPLERLLRVGEEKIAALPEAGSTAPPGAPRLAVEGSRLAREKAVDACPPLLAHASRLDPGGAGPDTASLDDERREAAPAKVPRNGQPGDPGTDDRDVAFVPSTRQPKGRADWDLRSGSSPPASLGRHALPQHRRDQRRRPRSDRRPRQRQRDAAAPRSRMGADPLGRKNPGPPRLLMIMDARTIAERLGLPEDVVRAVQRHGVLQRLDLDDAQIRERLWRAHCSSVARKGEGRGRAGRSEDRRPAVTRRRVSAAHTLPGVVVFFCARPVRRRSPPRVGTARPRCDRSCRVDPGGRYRALRVHTGACRHGGVVHGCRRLADLAGGSADGTWLLWTSDGTRRHDALCPTRTTCPFPSRKRARPVAAFAPRQAALELALRSFAETTADPIVVSLPTRRWVILVLERSELAASTVRPHSTRVTILASCRRGVRATVDELTLRHLYTPFALGTGSDGTETLAAVRSPCKSRIGLGARSGS